MQDGTQKSQKVFVNIPTEVGATEAEEIGTALLPVSATHSQCIAHSGMVPEPLLTHDPSRSRFREYFIPVSTIPCSQHSQHAPVTWLLVNPPSMAQAICQQVSEALFTHPTHTVTTAPV